MSQSTCPSRVDVLLAEESELPPAECEAIRAHLAACQTCRRARGVVDTFLKAAEFSFLPAGLQELLRAHLIACATCRAALNQLTIEEFIGVVTRCLSLPRQ